MLEELVKFRISELRDILNTLQLEHKSSIKAEKREAEKVKRQINETRDVLRINFEVLTALESEGIVYH